MRKAKRNTNSEIKPFDSLPFAAKEQYNLLRTSLGFTLPEDEICSIIGVTSPIRSEGKSTTSMNLAYSIANSGKRVLLIDGDMRIPTVAKCLNIHSRPGLSNILMAFDPDDVPIYRSEKTDNLFVIPAGTIPPNPSELIGSSRMKKVLDFLSQGFDFIIIDLPPVNIVSDPLEVSKFLSGLIVVIRENHTDKREILNCVRLLNLSNANILGYVYNSTTNDDIAYSKKYRYRKYKKYYKYDYTQSEPKNKQEIKE